MGNIRRQASSLLAAKLETRWQRLAARYLPITKTGSIWRYSRRQHPSEKDQGWKLHISATVLTANDALRKVAPILMRMGVMFKAPESLRELDKLNRGIFYGFSQVGKCMTVYPRSPSEAVTLARKLDRVLRHHCGPAVPYDRRLQPRSSVYYRYGAFGDLQIKLNGVSVSAIRTPNGELVPDRREPGAAVPDWLTNPFPSIPENGSGRNRLKTSIHAYRAITQRGKGGVYHALDTTVVPMRPCILKEGRRDGETDWDGRDGYWRVRHEAKVLTSLRAAGVLVPQVYSSFKSGDSYYVAIEFIEGTTLQEVLKRAGRGIPLHEAFRYGVQLTRLLDRIHASGWVWRDCKPLNLLVTRRGALRPIDFEGACVLGRSEQSPWGTPGYAPDESIDPSITSRLPEDLYALGASLYQLFTRRIPKNEDIRNGWERRRQRTPRAVRQLIVELMHEDPLCRPTARHARRRLERARQELKRSSQASGMALLTVGYFKSHGSDQAV